MKREDYRLEMGKTIFNFESVLYSQIYRVCEWIPLAETKDEMEQVESVLMVIRALARPDTNYFTRINLLNDAYKEKMGNIGKDVPDKEKLKLIFQKDYAFEHFDLLMDLLQRKGHLSFLSKGTIVFGDLMALDKQKEEQ